MTPEEQQIAIAKACRSHFHKPTEEEIKSGSYYQYEPDCLNDLNVMHSAAMTISRHLRHDYTMNLRAMVIRACNKPECYALGAERSQQIENFWFYEATAAQRAEAFLRTLNLWKD